MAGGLNTGYARAMRGAFTGSALALLLVLGDAPSALAQTPPAPRAEGPQNLQLATGGSRTRRQRPPVDAHTRKLRQTRGLLAGGIIFTAVCGVAFGLFTYAIVDNRGHLSGRAGKNALSATGTMLLCTGLSIATVAASAKRLRSLQGYGRISWTGGLGFRF